MPTITDPKEKIEFLLKQNKIPFKKEYRFHIPKGGEKQRKWRFDYAIQTFKWWPPIDEENIKVKWSFPIKIALEFEGGVFIPKSGHVSGLGYSKNCEKYNAAATLGWHVLRYTAPMIRKDAHQVIRDIQGIINGQ